MADATRLSVMSKQIEDNKQATDDLAAKMTDMMKHQSHIEAMVLKLVSPSSGQTSHASGLNASHSHASELDRMLAELKAMTANREATMSKFLSQASIPPRPPFPPPDPPDMCRFEQGLTDGIVFDKDNTVWLLNGVVTQRSKIELEVESIETGSSIQQIESCGVKDVLSTNITLSNGSNPEEESRPKETSTHKADSNFGEETITSNASKLSQVPSQESLYHLPVFDGTLLDCWIVELDRFFELKQYGNEEKFDLISLSLEGAALKWFRRHKREFTDWTDIKRKLMARFGLIKCCSPPEVLPKEESEPHQKKSHQIETFEVLSSLEPSHRCHNHYASLDVSDKDIGDEPVCDKDGDYILTVSAKFCEIEKDPRFELVCLKQTHDLVEIHLDIFDSALTRSSLRCTPTYQYGAPFNPYQNCNDQCDRESEEIEDDELKDKQPEEDIETLVMSKNEKSLECVDDESSVNDKLIEVIAEDTVFEPMDESGCHVYKERNLNSSLLQEFQIVLLHFKESSDTIVPRRNLDTRVLSSHFFAGGITLLSKMVCAFLLPFLKSRMICLDSRSIFIDDAAVALRGTMEDRFVLRIEEIYLESIKQNLEFAIDRGWVEFWINTHDFTLTNYGLRLSPSEYTKNIFILVYHHCKHSSSCLFLNTRTGCIGALLMLYDAKRLIQLDAPPVFSDLLCVMNRIRVRLKMVLLAEFLWLILFSSKMFRSSYVPQNKNQTNQKLSSYWKLLLRLLYPLHNNEWISFYMLMIKPAFKGKEETVSSNSAVISRSRFGFSPYSTWMISQNRHASSSCALRQEENCVLVLFTIAEALTIFNDQHTLVAEKNGTETHIVMKLIFGRATHQFLLKQSLFQVLLHTQIRDCSFFDYMLVATSDCFGTLLEIPNKEIAKPHRISFLTVLRQWKWYPPTQAIRSFAKLTMTSQFFIFEDKDDVKEGVL